MFLRALLTSKDSEDDEDEEEDEEERLLIVALATGAFVSNSHT